VNADPLPLLRAVSLFGPVTAALALWAWRRPGPAERAGLLLALLWNLCGLAILQLLTQRFGWWAFSAQGGLFLGMPVDAWIGWALLWGVVPVLALPRFHLPGVLALLLWIDLLLMPRGAPLLTLGPRWLAGEIAGLLLCAFPALLLARFTRDRRRLPVRVFLQMILFSLLLFFLLPEVILERTGGSWVPLLARPSWLLSVALQLLALPAVLGVSAVVEFARRGGGTPLPYDPPERLVTSGPYAYVANPMQIAAVLLLAGWGLLLGSPWVVAGGVMAHLYSLGLAGWDEGADLDRRFGPPWRAYRAAVRRWWPRFRPWHSPEIPLARLYLARGCGPCSDLARWFARRKPVGLLLLAAEDHPRRALERLTYDPGYDSSGAREEEGIAAFARALEHLHLGWAWLGWAMRLPFVLPFLQLVADASGAGPRKLDPGNPEVPRAL
jgi:protein-S-isoprenylcysteine O-methyltransferase Ste14